MPQLRHLAASTVASTALLLGAASASAAAVGDDLSTATGLSTTFTLAGATFTSPNGSYTVGPNGGLYSALPGTVLSSAGSVAELDIAFSAPMNQISFAFALGDFLGLTGDDSLTLTPDVGMPLVASATLPASDLFPQGTVAYSGAGFRSVKITGTEPIAIGNLQTATTTAIAAVPEPSTTALLAAGAMGLVAWRRRR